MGGLAEQLRRLHPRLLHDELCQIAREPHEDRQVDQGDRKRDVEDAIAQDHHQEERQDKAGKREQQVGRLHQHVAEKPRPVGDEQSDHRPQNGGDAHARDGNEKGQPRPVKDPRQNVPSHRVGAERMGEARRRQHGHDIHGVPVIGGDHRSEDDGEGDQSRNDGPGQCSLVCGKPLQHRDHRILGFSMVQIRSTTMFTSRTISRNVRAQAWTIG